MAHVLTSKAVATNTLTPSKGTISDFRRRRYFPVLDGIRAVSIFAVVLWHASPLFDGLRGHHGVTFFFVLSGFLITTLLLREEHKRGRAALRAFFVRRAFRILPLYYLALAIYCVLVLVLKVQPERIAVFRASLPYFAFYFQEYPHLAQWHGPFDLSWSLGIEEKFYLVWPVLGFGFAALNRYRPWMLLGIATLLVALPAGWFITPFLTPYVAIIVGCLLALALHNEPMARGLLPLARWPGLWLSLALASFAVHGGSRWTAVVATICGIALVALVLGEQRHSPTVRILQSAPIAYIGQRAYSIYLFHQIVLNVWKLVIPASLGIWGAGAVVALGFLTSLGVAAIMHRLVEAPLIAVGRRIADRLT